MKNTVSIAFFKKGEKLNSKKLIWLAHKETGQEEQEQIKQMETNMRKGDLNIIKLTVKRKWTKLL